MTKKEKQEYSELPFKYLPMGGWDYLGWSFVYSIPVFGIFFVIVNALRSSNIARRNHARSFLAGFLVIVLLLAIAGAVIYFTGFYKTIIEFYETTIMPAIAPYIEMIKEMMGATGA